MKDGKDVRKCPIHKTWKRKGVCEPCQMKLDEIKKAGGSYKPKVIIRKI